MIPTGNKSFYRWMTNGLIGITTIVFLISAVNYTKINRWKKIVLRNIKTGSTQLPMAPATKYLTEDDLRIFGHIKNKVFLSLPWKSLVISAATGNIPLHTKSSSVGVKTVDYYQFMSSNCVDKLNTARFNTIAYIYSPYFACPGFELVDQSREGLILYKTRNVRGLVY